MAVNWGLAQPQFNALDVLRSYGMAQQQAMAQRKAARDEQAAAAQLAARRQAAGQLQAGDYAAAGTTALGAGDFDLYKHVSGLHEDQKKAVAARSETLGRVAFSLQGVPQAERGARLQAIAPMLIQQGFTPDELQQADLSDAGIQGYIAVSQSVKDALAGQLTQARTADIGTDNQRADRTAGHSMAVADARLGLAQRADGRASEARGEGRVRFKERDKDRAAVAAGGRGLRTDLSDLDY